MLVVDLPLRAQDAPLADTPHARAFLVAPGAPAPEGADAAVDLPDGARFVYAPLAGSGSGAMPVLPVDPFLRGNAFRPLHDSPRAQAALLSVAAARRVDTGPESERMFLALRGNGLVFEENGDTHRFGPRSLVVAPAGEPARVWAQGPEDALLVVFQPKGASAPRRTLRSEIERLRGGGR